MLEFSGEVFFWRGPSPFHFVTVPALESGQISELAPIVSYGWGCIPVAATVGRTEWATSLFPKDGGYLVPIKDAVRRAEDIELGDDVSIRLEVTARPPARRPRR